MYHQELVQGLLDQTTIGEEDDYRRFLEWDADLGFMRQIGAEREDGVVVVGFCNGQPTPPEGNTLPEVIMPRTKYQQLTGQERSIGLQGKGTGPRLYNKPSAITGLKNHTDTVGMYSVEIDREHILDTRKSSDFTLSGRVQRIAQHAGLHIRSRITSVRSTIIDINYGFPTDTQAVLYNQPPNAERRENTEEEALGIISEFMVIRSATLSLLKRGEAHLY